MREALSIAVAQPAVVPGDVAANARAHAELVRVAGARVVAFPELSLTGYDLAAAAVSPTDPALAPLVAACARAGTVAFAGAPTTEPDGREHIGVLRVDGDGARVAYGKLFLGGDEPARFAAGPGAAVVDVDGWRLGLGVCKDTGVEEHAERTGALGIDVYVAGLVHGPGEHAELEVRARRIAAQTGAHVALASAAGPNGAAYPETAGGSGVWAPDGTVLARAGTAPGAVAHVTLG